MRRRPARGVGGGTAPAAPPRATALLLGPDPGGLGRAGRNDGPAARAERLRLEHPDVAVAQLRKAIRDPDRLPAALRGLGSRRVVLAGALAGTDRPALLAALHRGGAAPGAAVLVDLEPAPDADPQLYADHAAIAIAAALARVQAADLRTPEAADLRATEAEGPLLSAGPLPRRALLGLRAPTRRPIAGVRAGAAAAGCGGCASHCPHGAIRIVAGRPRIDAGRCTGCGRCVAACPSGAYALPTAATAQLAAAFAVLADAVRSRPEIEGLVLRCDHAQDAAGVLGSGWLPLALPSLEMVSPGWVLQLIVRGARRVRLDPCPQQPCRDRAGAVERYTSALLARLGDPDRPAPAPAGPVLSEPAGPLLLSEPAATAAALIAACHSRGGPMDWRLTDPASPLGTVEVEPNRCTLCGTCTLVCPTRAISLEDTGDVRRLRFDPARCQACAACEPACPERALHVLAATDLAALRAGPTSLVTATGRRCPGCGSPLPSAPLADRVAGLLATSHPLLAARVAGHCPRCGGVVSAAAGRARRRSQRGPS